jgi:hypothetical protein
MSVNVPPALKPVIADLCTENWFLRRDVERLMDGRVELLRLTQAHSDALRRIAAMGGRAAKEARKALETR